MQIDDQDLPTMKPYHLRAIWEWCADNGLTPHLAVSVDRYTQVPREFVRDGQIVLNIGPVAAHKLAMGNEFIEFHARFGGVARQISIPVGRVTAIFARENGAGMSFEIEEMSESSMEPLAAAPLSSDPEPPPDKPRLQRVK